MDIRAPLIVSVLIVGGMLAISIWAWPSIPDGASVAIHWTLGNSPNGFAPKTFALLALPAMASLLALVFCLMLPRATGDKAAAQNATAYEIGWIGGLGVLAIVHVLVVLTARGYQPDIAGNCAFAIALLTTVLGNFLGRTRRNPFVGVRTYWTLTSAYSWERSNRAAGRLFVVAGLATLGALAAAGSRTGILVLVAGMLAAVLVSVALSYVYWKNDPERDISG